MKHPNYDGFLWVFPRRVVRIRMTSRNSLYNAPAKKVSNLRLCPTCGGPCEAHNFQNRTPELFRELRFRRARAGHKNPPRPEIREKITKKKGNPPPRGGARKYEKITEKIQKWSFPGHFCIFSVIFSFFRAPTRGGGFVFFS